MSGKQTAVKRSKTRRRRKRADEERGTGGVGASALVALQQRFGNRALQRLLLQGQKPSDLKQEPETEPQKTGERVKTPSGFAWVRRFPTSKRVEDLDSGFQADVKHVQSLLEKAGATVEILSTTLPSQRAYLMHWSWRIAREEVDPREVPDKKGVDIQWWHGDPKSSRDAAWEMVKGYKTSHLKEPPPLKSPYTEGKVAATRIRWTGELVFNRDAPDEIIIDKGPTNATNPALIDLIEGLHLAHLFTVPDSDEVHWISDEE